LLAADHAIQRATPRIGSVGGNKKGKCDVGGLAPRLEVVLSRPAMHLSKREPVRVWPGLRSMADALAKPGEVKRPLSHV
jgi:hypothetical protein